MLSFDCGQIEEYKHRREDDDKKKNKLCVCSHVKVVMLGTSGTAVKIENDPTKITIGKE